MKSGCILNLLCPAEAKFACKEEFLDDLFNKAKELAQDPANQERLKKMAQERFGGGSKGADQSEGAPEDLSGNQSPESTEFGEDQLDHPS